MIKHQAANIQQKIFFPPQKPDLRTGTLFMAVVDQNTGNIPTAIKHDIQLVFVDFSSVEDPLRFQVDPDPDPLMRS